MTRSDFQGAAVSLGLHALALAVLLWLSADFTSRPQAARPASSRTHATRVSLLGRALSVRPMAAANPPVVPRNRGPTRRQVTRPDPTEAWGEPLLGESSAATPPRAAGASVDQGDLLLGVLNDSADALGGDVHAAKEAVAGARLAVGLPVARKEPDLRALNARLAAAAETCWPEAARRYHQRGEAVVHFCLDTQGALIDAQVKTSSGSTLLDGAAEGCVIPKALPAGPEVGAGCFNLPVRFGREGAGQ